MENPRILIVDDEMMHLDAIMDIVEDAGCNCEIFTALNGKTALEIAQKEMPDLIISDWEMPEMNGIELIKHLKNKTKTIDIPIIMCTGIMTTSENLETALNVGAVDYVRKPVDKIELTARIKANLHLAEKYSEVKKLNKTLTDKYSEIEKLNEAKDRMFSVISHDLRGPVGTTKAFMDLILENINDYSVEELEELIAMLSKQSSSVFAILENLLLWANCQRKIINFEPVRQLVVNVINNNISLLNASASQKGVIIQNNIPEDLTLNFDYDLISTVLRNLITNAIKFTKQGGTVSVNIKKGEKFHTIIVSDNGIGISSERVGKIFDKTSYETTKGTDSEKGSGLGLKLCLEFIEIHKGKIWVESEVGKGSNFCFTLSVN